MFAIRHGTNFHKLMNNLDTPCEVHKLEDCTSCRNQMVSCNITCRYLFLRDKIIQTSNEHLLLTFGLRICSVT